MGESEDTAEPITRKGILLRLSTYLGLLSLLLIIGLSVLTFQPRDLSDIDGYREGAEPLPTSGPDLASVLRNAEKAGHSVIITEKELNEYLLRTLSFKQTGAFEGWFRARGVWVRLGEGEAEVILEREMLEGERHTISMILRPEQTETDSGLNTSVHRRRGWWGRVKVWGGMLRFTQSSFSSLADQYEEELELIEKLFRSQMRITIEDKKVTLIPADA